MNNLLILILSTTFLLAGTALADSEHSNIQNMKAQVSDRQAEDQLPIFMAVGVVQNTDPANDTVTIAHQAIDALKWPAMTMPFVVGGKGLFNRLKVGDKVAFELRLEDGKAVIVNVK